MNNRFILKCIEETEELINEIVVGGFVDLELIKRASQKLNQAHDELIGFTVDGYAPEGGRSRIDSGVIKMF